MSGLMPVCPGCKHFRRNVAGFTCDAFPAGVPREIISGASDHKAPYQGDNGILFEPLPGARIRSQAAEWDGPSVSPAFSALSPAEFGMAPDGRWAGGPLGAGHASPVPAVEPVPLTATAVSRKLFKREVPAHELARLGGCLDDGTCRVEAKGEDLRLRVFGPGYYAERTVGRDDAGKLFVHNASNNFAARGRNIATRMLAAQVGAGQRLGVDYLAARAQGGPEDTAHKGYADLPLLGFDGPVPPEARLPDHYQPAATILDVLHQHHGGDDHGLAAWEKNGAPFDGKFDLSPGSRSLHVWDDYLHERRASGAPFSADFAFPEHPARPEDEPRPPEEAPLDWEERRAAHNVWRRRQASRFKKAFPVTPVTPSATSGATAGPPAAVPGSSTGGIVVTEGAVPLMALVPGEVLGPLADACFDLASGLYGPAVFREVVLDSLADALFAAGLAHHRGHFPQADDIAVNAFAARAGELLDAAGAFDTEDGLPSWAALLAAVPMLAAADWPGFVAFASSSVTEEAPPTLDAALFADEDFVRVPAFMGRCAWLANYLAGRTVVDFSSPFAASVTVGGDTAFFAFPRPTPAPASAPAARRLAAGARNAFPGHLTAAAKGKPAPVRKAPAGTVAVSKPRLEEHDDHPGATERSRAVAEQLRRRVRGGRLHETAVKAIHAGVSSLTDAEAAHVYKSAVKGGHAPKHAGDAADKLAQSLRNHTSYSPPADPASLEARLGSYKDGDAILAGAMQLARQQSFDRRALGAAVAGASDQLKKLLDMPPRGSPGVTPESTRQLGTLESSLQLNLTTARNLLAKVTAANTSLRQSLAAMLAAHKPLPVQATGAGDLPKEAADGVVAAVAFLVQVFSLKHGENGNLTVAVSPCPPDERRGHYQSDTPGSATLFVGPTRNEAEALHLLGHACEEHVAGVRALCKSFLSFRCAREKPVALESLPGGLCLHGEEGRRDDFKRAFAPPTDAFVGKMNDSGATEVLSMALSALWSDPVALARDPQLFKLLVGILRGDLR